MFAETVLYKTGMEIKAGSWSGGDYNYGYNGLLKVVFNKNFLHYDARTYNSELNDLQVKTL